MYNKVSSRDDCGRPLVGRALDSVVKRCPVLYDSHRVCILGYDPVTRALPAAFGRGGFPTNSNSNNVD